MSKILATFKLRNPISGIGNLLRAINYLLDNGSYRVKSPLNPLHPKHLYLELFQTKANHPTLKLDLPLVYDIPETKIKEAIHQIDSKCRFISSDDETISFVTCLLPEVPAPANVISESQQYVLQHTFEIRKEAPGLDKLLHCISSMSNELGNHLICSFDPSTHRCLQINLFSQNFPHPIVICSRRLKTPKKNDGNIVSQINIASCYNTIIHLGYDEANKTISIYVEPPDFDTSSRLRLALAQLQ